MSDSFRILGASSYRISRQWVAKTSILNCPNFQGKRRRTNAKASRPSALRDLVELTGAARSPILGFLVGGLLLANGYAAAQEPIYSRGEYRPVDCSTDYLKVVPVVALYSKKFENACRIHDACYRYGHATYGRSKGWCDDRFLDNMKAACSSWDLTCLGAANSFYAGVAAVPGSRSAFKKDKRCYEFENRSATTELCRTAHNAHGALAHVPMDGGLDTIYRLTDRWRTADLLQKSRSRDGSHEPDVPTQNISSLSKRNHYYTTREGRVRRLLWHFDDGWVTEDLTSYIGNEFAQNMISTTNNDGYEHAYFTDTEGDIRHVWYNRRWKTDTPSDTSGAARPNGDVRAFASAARYSHVVYLTADDSLAELHTNHRQWFARKWQGVGGDVKLKDVPFGYGFRGRPHFFAISQLGQVWHYYLDENGRQRGFDLSKRVANKSGKDFLHTGAVTTPIGYAFKDTQHMFLVTRRGDVVEYHWNADDGWAMENLTEQTGAPLATTSRYLPYQYGDENDRYRSIIQAEYENGIQRVYYLDENSELVEIYMRAGEAWSYSLLGRANGLGKVRSLGQRSLRIE